MSSRRFRPPSHSSGCSLVSCLTPAVDGARQLLSDFGFRSYRVFLVWVEWSQDENGDGRVRGDERFIDPGEAGAGRGRVLREIEILPAPQVSPFSAIGEDPDPTGLTERGAVFVSEISLDYSERILRGLLPEFQDPEHVESIRHGVEFFWEIQALQPRATSVPGISGTRDTALAIRRRFSIATLPARSATEFQWSISLTRADGDRTPFGGLS